jgi:hypothetical protein
MRKKLRKLFTYYIIKLPIILLAMLLYDIAPHLKPRPSGDRSKPCIIFYSQPKEPKKYKKKRSPSKRDKAKISMRSKKTKISFEIILEMD